MRQAAREEKLWEANRAPCEVPLPRGVAEYQNLSKSRGQH